MTTIRLKENEPFDVALRRFKRTIEKLGLLTDLRAREFYEKPTTERKRKKSGCRETSLQARSQHAIAQEDVLIFSCRAPVAQHKPAGGRSSGLFSFFPRQFRRSP